MQSAERVTPRRPDRHLAPRCDSPFQQPFRLDPDQLGPFAGDLTNTAQQLSHRGVPGRADGVDRTGHAVTEAVPDEGGQVAHIDVLQGQLARSGRERRAAPSQAGQPPGQSPVVLARPENATGPVAGHAIGPEFANRGQLGAALVGSVGRPAGIGVGVHDRCRLVGAVGPGLIDRAGGDVAVATVGGGEQPSGGDDRTRRLIPGVDHEIGIRTRQRPAHRIGVETVGHEGRDPVRQGRMPPAQAGDPPPPRQRVAGQSATHETSAAEYQYVLLATHAITMAGVRCERPHRRPSCVSEAIGPLEEDRSLLSVGGSMSDPGSRIGA